MERENLNQIHLMVKSVSENEKRLKEHQIRIQQMLQKVKNQSEPVTVALEPVVQDEQEINFHDTPVVHEPFDQVVEKFPDMPAVLDEKPVVHENFHDDFQEDIPEAAMVHEVLIVARQDINIEAIPDLHTYVSYDPYEPLPVSEESYAAHSGACPDDFMGSSENSLYDLMFSDKSSEHYNEDELTSSQVH